MVEIAFGMYRVLLNFWMLLGLSFFGSLISFITRYCFKNSVEGDILGESTSFC